MTIPPNEQETISKYNTHSLTPTHQHTHVHTVPAFRLRAMHFYFGLSLRLQQQQRQQQQAQLLMMLLPVCLVGEKKVLPKRVVGVWVRACVCATTCSRNIYRSWQSQVMKNLRSLHEDVMKSVPASQPGWDSELELKLKRGLGSQHSMRPTHTQEMCAGRMRCMYLFASSSFSSSSFFFVIFTARSGISTGAQWMSLCPEPWARSRPRGACVCHRKLLMNLINNMYFDFYACCFTLHTHTHTYTYREAVTPTTSIHKTHVKKLTHNSIAFRP